MKRYIQQISGLLILTLALLGCQKDERDINMNITPVTNLFTPAESQYIQLRPADNLSEVFEWEQALAEDGALVMYEVAFDQEGGDFSAPFYKVVSDNRGTQTKLTLTHGNLNQIAALGGAEFMERKKFKWTVIASKGTNRVVATMSRVIDLERPSGFEEIPGSVYLTGEATEAGTTLASALKMKQLEPGVFEIFTKLKAGTYHFVDAITGTPKEFYTFVDGGTVKLGINGETTFSGPDKIMRIRLDFNNINGSYAEVKEIALWYSQANAFWFTLDYDANGVWRKNNYTTNLGSMPWGFDERYKYRMKINMGGADQDLWLNYSTNDSPGQDGQYPHTLAYKTINMETNNGSQWDWTFKFDRNYLTQGSVVNYWVSLRSTDPAYTINYQKQ